MARDIEEFLRKAAERRKAAAQGKPATPPVQPKPQPKPVARQPRPSQPKPPQTRREPVQAELAPRGSSVADHVRAHIDTSDVTQSASKLGEQVGLADDRLEQRLHDTFDHAVGSLTGKSMASPVHSRDEFEHELTRMLRNPQTVRNAILLAEILKRPEF